MKDEELVKLSGMTFGLNLDSKEVDLFLIENLQKKHKYLSTLHLPFIGKVVVINLASVLWFFIKV